MWLLLFMKVCRDDKFISPTMNKYYDFEMLRVTISIIMKDMLL